MQQWTTRWTLCASLHRFFLIFCSPYTFCCDYFLPLAAKAADNLTHLQCITTLLTIFTNNHGCPLQSEASNDKLHPVPRKILLHQMTLDLKNKFLLAMSDIRIFVEYGSINSIYFIVFCVIILVKLVITDT
jgi:hypothetical protein